MKFLRNKKLAFAIVIIVIVGLVFAYVPLLFAPRETAQPESQNETNPPVNATASLTPVQEENNQATETEEESPATEPQSAVSSSQPIEFEGLEGLGDEQDALDELNQLFE